MGSEAVPGRADALASDGCVDVDRRGGQEARVLLHLSKRIRGKNAPGRARQDVLRTESRGVAQPGRAPGSGPGGRRFKSSLPDHSFSRQFNDLGRFRGFCFCDNSRDIRDN